jgi:hypothetical protein
MPSLAVDKNGDMAIGYSVSDSSMYPAIRYAGRLVGDPASTLGQGETSLIEGSGFQCCTFSNGSTNTRWGDYSAMTIDPDGCTFWYTNEYYANKPTMLSQDNWQTRIGSFKFGTCAVAAPTLTATPSTVAGGGTVTVSWSNVVGPTTTDWIALYHPGDANTAYIDWIYDDSCTRVAGSNSLSSGSCSFQMPSKAGTYEFRLLPNDTFSVLATSGQVTVN